MNNAEAIKIIDGLARTDLLNKKTTEALYMAREALIEVVPDSSIVKLYEVRCNDSGFSYTVTKESRLKNDFYLLFGDGSCSGNFKVKEITKDKLLYRGRSLVDAVNWMMEHREDDTE